MTNEEFSNEFDVMLSGTGVTLNEYEKSVFLTKAQEETVINLYNGKNIYGDSFESTEEIRRYLDSLVKSATLPPSDKQDHALGSSYFFKLPEDLAFLTLEQVKFGEGAKAGKCSLGGTIASVFPVTHDEYTRIKDDPFRGPTRYKVLRLEYGTIEAQDVVQDIVELVSKYKIAEYIIRYVSKPTPIVLVDLNKSYGEDLSVDGEKNITPCKINPLLHKTILTRAVQLAISLRATKSTKDKN